MDLDLDDTLLEILACPACHSRLALNEEARELQCDSAACGLAYPIRDNIPIMLVSEARDTRLK